KSKGLAPTTSFLAHDLLASTRGESKETKLAAAQPYIKYVQELDRQGKLAKGAVDRFKKIIGASGINVDTTATVNTTLRVNLEHDGGKIRDKLVTELKKNRDKFQGLPILATADLDITKIGATTKKQIDALRKIIADPTSRKQDRKDAQDAIDKLSKSSNDFAKATEKDQDAASRAVKKASDAIVDKLNAQRKASDAARFAQLDLNAAYSNQPKPGEPSGTAPAQNPNLVQNPFLSRRRGGGLPAFVTGGAVWAHVSPGEEILDERRRSLGFVPGAPVAADSVTMPLPANGYVLTGDMQDRLAAGESFSHALAFGAPHFRKGGSLPAFAAGGGIGPARTAQAAKTAGFTGAALKLATAIAGAESGWRPGATNQNTNGTVDRGLWQINSIHRQYDAQRLFDPGYNARAAWAISGHGSNWHPWVTYNTGAYQKYMSQAGSAAAKARGGAGTFDDKSVGVPILMGAAKYGPRAGLIDGAFSSAFSRASGGFGTGQESQYGRLIGTSAQAALRQAQTMRQTTAKGGGSDASSSSTGGVSTEGVTPIAGVKAGIGAYGAAIAKKFGLSVTSTTGGTHAKNSLHYQGRAVDLAGSRMKEAAYWIGAAKSRYGQLAEGIHQPGLSVKNGSKVPTSFWGSTVWDQHKNHLHLAMRRGGRLPGFRAGGAVPSLASVRTPGGTQAYSEKLADAVDGAATRNIDRLREAMQAAADRGGTKKA
ncbi:MAG: transglycosylase SLT domain-containing protein, partial [Patulibacter sp.]|nr:transglycosylase SLT domain-containing protein [Patulibacter sp.]